MVTLWELLKQHHGNRLHKSFRRHEITSSPRPGVRASSAPGKASDCVNRLLHSGQGERFGGPAVAPGDPGPH
jgi:hypothetical protein